MIHKDEMMTPLLEACPSFRPNWLKFVAEWPDEKDGPPLYIALADLARHLIGMLERGDTGTFPMIFQVVELWHTEGDGYVKEAATVGLLEDLQNTNLHTATKPEQFRPFLGPVSSRWWDKLYGFWERGELLTEDGDRSRYALEILSMFPRPLLYGFLLGSIGFAADLLVPMIFNLTSGNGHLISTFIMGPGGFVLGCLIGAVPRRKE